MTQQVKGLGSSQHIRRSLMYASERKTLKEDGCVAYLKKELEGVTTTGVARNPNQDMLIAWAA